MCPDAIVGTEQLGALDNNLSNPRFNFRLDAKLFGACGQSGREGNVREKEEEEEAKEGICFAEKELTG